MYADDTAFYFGSSNIDDFKSHIQADLALVYDWLNSNKLSLNVAKTTSMVICNQQKRRHINNPNIDLNVNSEPLDQTASTPYLGIEVDENLDFRPQFKKQISKINRSIGVLNRVSPFIPMKTAKTLFNTIVLPHYDYCCPVWSSLPSN